MQVEMRAWFRKSLDWKFVEGMIVLELLHAKLAMVTN
jgi:hypothetical protein